MTPLLPLTCEERDLYYKLYYYSIPARQVRVFLFPKPDQATVYNIASFSIAEDHADDVIELLEEGGILNSLKGQWCSGEVLGQVVTNKTLLDCQPRLSNYIQNNFKEETLCQICKKSQLWKNILVHGIQKCLPACLHCKALLVF